MTPEKGQENTPAGPLDYKRDIVPNLQGLDPNIPVAQFTQFSLLQQGMPKVVQVTERKLIVTHLKKGGTVEVIVEKPIEEWEVVVISVCGKEFQFPRQMLLSQD